MSCRFRILTCNTSLIEKLKLFGLKRLVVGIGIGDWAAFTVKFERGTSYPYCRSFNFISLDLPFNENNIIV